MAAAIAEADKVRAAGDAYNRELLQVRFGWPHRPSMALTATAAASGTAAPASDMKQRLLAWPVRSALRACDVYRSQTSKKGKVPGRQARLAERDAELGGARDALQSAQQERAGARLLPTCKKGACCWA